MIITAKNNQDFVYAYIVFNVVDDESKMTNIGRNLFINGFWVHPSKRKISMNTLKLFIFELFLHPETQSVENVYWENKHGKVVRHLAYKFLRRFGLLIQGDYNGKRQTNDNNEPVARAEVYSNC